MGEKVGEHVVMLTKTGWYRGIIEESEMVTFKGIKYATFKPWQRPVPVPKSTDIIDALEYGPDSSKGDPGCLTLSIYMNQYGGNPKKKVYFWQYGSAQVGGSDARHNYEEFVKANQDIIVVTTNHRGNVYGSLDLSVLSGDEGKESLYEASNNLARLDLLEALKWVHENIAKFGGDPESITIGGHSSGSNNMTCLMMMPEAYPYFSQALCQASFCMDISLETRETAKKVSSLFYEILGVKTVDELLSKSTDEINEASGKLMRGMMTKELSIEGMENKLFSPVMDNVVLSEDCFKKMAEGGLSGKKFMIGCNSGEYDQQFERFLKEENPEDSAWEFTIQENFGKLSNYGWNKDRSGEMIHRFRSHNILYGRDDFTAAKDLKNDLFMRDAGIAFALALSKRNTVYMYYNDWSLNKKHGKRAYHGSENDIVARRWEEVPEEEMSVAENLSKLFARFILKGDLDYSEAPFTSAPFTKENFETLYFDEKNPRMVSGVRKEDVELFLPLLREYPDFSE